MDITISLLYPGTQRWAILALLLAKDNPKKVKRALAYSPDIQPDGLAVFPQAITAMSKILTENKDLKQKALNQLMLN